MKYELTPTGYALLRKLMADVRLLLAEFYPHPDMANQGFMHAPLVRESDVLDLATRCLNMMTLPMAISGPVTQVSPIPAAPALPMPPLPQDVREAAEAAEAKYQEFAAPSSDDVTRGERIQQYRYDRGFKDAVAGEPPTEGSVEYQQGWEAGKAGKTKLTLPTRSDMYDAPPERYDIASQLEQAEIEVFTDAGRALVEASRMTSSYLPTKCDCDLRDRLWNGFGKCLRCGLKYDRPSTTPVDSAVAKDRYDEFEDPVTGEYLYTRKKKDK